MTTAGEQGSQIRAGCYCRISSDPKDKREGVTRQRDDTAALCEVKGWTVTDFYVDNDRSASSGKDRPEWDRLLSDIAEGKVDAIAAWDQDRGWRMMHELESLRRFFTGLGREIKLATTGQGDIDLYTPTGVMMAQVKTAVSEHEIAMMRVRQRRAARQRAEKGIPKWRRAFGYLETPAGPVPDPALAPLIRDGYAAILAGSSLRDVARMWNDAGALTQKWTRRRDDNGEVVLDPTTGRPQMVCTRQPWQESIVSEFIRKPRNAGLRDHNGEIVGKGNWEPLVDESLWRAVQAAMASRPAGGPRGVRAVRRHHLTGMMLCGRCDDGATLGASHTPDKRIAYACRQCRKVSIRAGRVEPRLIELVGRRLAREDAVDLLRAEIHDEAEAQRLRDEKATLYRERAKLAVERANRLLTGEQVKIATDIIQAQLDAIDRQEEDAERVRVFDGIPLGTPEAGAAVEALSPDRLRAVMRVIMEVTIAPVGKHGNRFDKDRIKVRWKS